MSRYTFQKQKGYNKALFDAIQNKGWTITEFAFKLGISKGHASNIINNKIKISDTFKIRIAKLFKVDSRIIFPEKETKNDI